MYLPIAEHGVVGDLRTVALVGTDGTIDWYCCPRFDSPSVFGAILDRKRGGYYRIAPTTREGQVKQLYFPDTNVLITRFLTPAGVGEVQDFMPVAPPGSTRQRLIRRVLVRARDDDVPVEVEPRFDYGRASHDTVVSRERARLPLARPDARALHGDRRCSATADGVRGEFTLEPNETARSCSRPCRRRTCRAPFSEAETREDFESTVAFWRRWLAQSRYRGRWREMVNRSALALKLLTYQPTGAMVAAPTTSLPEQLGGARNWDYRYTWIRDTAFSLYALLRLGFADEAAAFMDWLTDRFRERAGTDSGPLQIMYGIDGSAELPEELLDHLEGYRGSAPVRIGNEAADQLQLDIYGELIDSVYLYNKYGTPISHGAWSDLARIVEWVCENWDQADEGIWEVRGGRQHFTYSRLMSWVAVERAIRIAQMRALPADVNRWAGVRDEIYHQVMSRGWNEDRGAFVQHYDTEVLDASVLLMPLTKFVSPTDPRWLTTLDAIGKELVSDSLVYRYNVEAAPDGLEGAEGTFSICTFWYVEALARAGHIDDARLAFEKMLTYANHLGLYSEQIGATGELLGNFPQAFTHLALISAAVNLDLQLGS